MNSFRTGTGAVLEQEQEQFQNRNRNRSSFRTGIGTVLEQEQEQEQLQNRNRNSFRTGTGTGEVLEQEQERFQNRNRSSFRTERETEGIFVLFRFSTGRTFCNVQIFYWTHFLYLVFWMLVILHAPNFWKWFIGPCCLFIIEKCLRLVSSIQNYSRKLKPSGNF